MEKGTLYWLTGLSGAGKTTIGKIIFNHLRTKKQNVIFLDGDVLREVFHGFVGHALEERRKLAGHYGRLAKMLTDQGIDVVCATISLFHDVQAWNREHIPQYREIHLRAPMDILHGRDPKGIYARARAGELKNVYGIDLPAEEPKTPELIVDNDGSRAVEIVAQEIMNHFSL